MNAATTRIEHDLLGGREVPDAACYGAHTLRAPKHFHIADISIAVYAGLAGALVQTRQAAG